LEGEVDACVDGVRADNLPIVAAEYDSTESKNGKKINQRKGKK